MIFVRFSGKKTKVEFDFERMSVLKKVDNNNSNNNNDNNDNYDNEGDDDTSGVCVLAILIWFIAHLI